jgi:hypothetical protein
MAIGDALSPLKAACYAALTADATTMSLVTGIFDGEAPVNQPFNYITMDQDTQVSDNVMGKGGRECTITFGIWTQGSMGSKVTLSILDAMTKALDHKSLTLSTATPAQICTWAELDNYNSLQETDGLTYHGIPRFRFKTQEV